MLAFGLTGCGKLTPKPKPVPSTGSTVPSGAVGALSDGGPVRAPQSGAYVGAFAMGTDFTNSAQIEAVGEFERRIGRRLDIAHTYTRFNEAFDSAADLALAQSGHIMLLSWAGADTRVITSGDYDKLIRDNALLVKRMQQPVLLEWRWEMDRPNLRAEVWSAADYIAAWSHIQNIFRAEQVTNASWVWCPTALGFQPGGDAADFYPGDDRVDWLCANGYPSATQPKLRDVLAPFLAWAAQHPKPVMIGEYGVSRSLSPAERAELLREDADLFRSDSQIRAVCYFDGDPDGNKITLQWGIRDDATALAGYAAMARDPYFNPAKQVVTDPV